MRVGSVSTRPLGVRPGWRQRLDRLRGTPIEYDLRGYDAGLARVNALEPACMALSDVGMLERGRALRDRARGGEPRDRQRAECFALVREAARRVLGERPFDEQVVAALALDQGRIVEMQTGEGKTLAAVMPASLNALEGRGVHVLTFNDYLARRDAGWMGAIYRAIGLSVAAVAQELSTAERTAAYRADVTYVTAKEAGFDHLRDRLASHPDGVVHRPFHMAIVDEADSLMIDEARVPLVIAGRVEAEGARAPRMAEIVRALECGVHYDTDEYARDVELTEAGIEHVERTLGATLHDGTNLVLLTELHCALHAHVLLRRDVDYIVRSGRVEIVDEFTGRVVADRHWPDGLQAALEAKEGLARRPDGRILGSMTLQHFLRGYRRLCGMTGTARSAAGEFAAIYGLEVAVIPTHRPAVRLDRNDLLFTDREAKDRAVVASIRDAHAAGRPVLVGTASVTESERLAAALETAGIACAILNAKHDAEEAELVARAGALGSVTISTNMAGRGTDIRLGGPDERDRDRVAALGGLYVIGTNLHESRRVDLQLRGRAGRQGDPGESRFFVSLEDDLLVRYGIRSLIPPRLMPARSDDPIEHPIIAREVGRAQRIVEGQNYEIRQTLGRYSAVLERQYQLLGERRAAVLTGEALPGVWATDPDRRGRLVVEAGEPAVIEAERTVALASIDRAWREHLAFCADLREGIHLVRIGGRDPLTYFTNEAIQAFARMDQAIDDAVLGALATVRVVDGRLDLTDAGLKAPSATWTYLVNDDPFKNRLGALLTGPGGATLAMYSAVMLMPLFILWGVVDRVVGRRRR